MLNLKYLDRHQSSELVAIVVPLSNRKDLTPEEEISLRHLLHFLGKYDKYFVAPKNLQFDYPGFEIKRFDDKFFGSLEAHKKLLFSPKFYKAFIDYKYMLIYHLDALVFSDQLIQWCNTDFDYIGAPWIKHAGSPYAGMNIENKVGNGGFSLRKIESFLNVIYSTKYYINPISYWKNNYDYIKKSKRFFDIPKKLLKFMFLKYFKVFNNARYEMSKYPYNDEVFISNRAAHYYPEFRIAPLEVALRFAFECAPRLCFEKNNYSLPFGCHAWQKYDRAFWEPYLLKEIAL